MVTPAARREAVAHLEASLEVSERRACSIIAADRSSVRYRSRRPDDAALRARLRELADLRRRFGYRRLHVLLRGEGWTMNRKKTQRLYREEGLGVRRRRPRRRIAAARTPIPRPEGPNCRWPLVDGLRARPARLWAALPGADHHRRRDQGMPRRRPGHLAHRQAGGARDGRADRAARAPRRHRSRYGTEFTSAAVLAFTQAAKLDWRYIAPGKPTENAFAESFQGRMRDECLNEHLFFSMNHARASTPR